MNKVFSIPFCLPYSAVNANGRVKVDWLLNAFQDTASTQCHHLGISGYDMARKRLKWVVAQYTIRIHDPMEWMTPLILNTWRSTYNNLYEVRHFSLGEENRPPTVTATSVWVLIKANNGKPVRLSPNMPPELMEETSGPVSLKRPEPFEDSDHDTCFPVTFLDLDMNQHVNNRVYLRWAVESLPAPYCFEYAPCNCLVIYKKEGLYGDEVTCRTRLSFKGSRLASDHSIVSKSTGEELARLQLEWLKISPIEVFKRHDT